ncbi:MAG: N-acetyl-gamma-glutamyl-phosphate reductase [Ruminococcaceae bacterium]|nr:N-acetyl-gamma-glutamyl-phosphate reductase [Oscillospiraceae bacterium]
MAIKVFIDGSVGTTGLRIHERLSARPDIELITIAEENRKELAARKEAILSADAAFLCLPDTASIEIIEAIGDAPVKVLDTSTAHRTNPAWAYGFPELSKEFKEKLLSSNRIAVPGCHASGFCSIVKPLIDNGIIPADYPVVCTSVTGYSGGGKKMIAEYEQDSRSEIFDSPRQYGLTQKHKHLPEMKAVCGLDFEPCFSPIVADFYSGMTVSVPLAARLLSKKVTAEDIHGIFAEHYAGQKMISVRPFGQEGMLGTNEMSGKDSMEIIVSGNDDRILIASTFDNLGKGASGAAIQCFNLITGTDEITGLVL